ncbi:MAG TPA: helix-turn-helix domain-containing protein [Kofleriaceae bacterium]|nr:helix-turn-helix domain-containing protein [Kofleriaceae bacterium]
MTATSENPKVPRPLRADARRNVELLVAAAEAEFNERGAGASLEDIARRAGVGIGTLYRHFPTRDDLIAKVLDESTRAIVARGRALLDEPEPGAQLARWITELVEYVTTYRGVIAALAAGFVAANGTQLCVNCEAITAAGAALLARAQAAGEIRTDADVREVILTAHSAAWIAEQTRDPGAVDRLLRILFDGLRATAVAPATRPAPPRAVSRRPRGPRAKRS